MCLSPLEHTRRAALRCGWAGDGRRSGASFGAWRDARALIRYEHHAPLSAPILLPLGERHTGVVPNATPDHVVVRLPTWISGGSPNQFGANARWDMTPVETEPGAWNVSLRERCTAQPAGLVRLSRLADAATLGNLADDPSLQALAVMPFSFPGVTSPMAQDEIQRIAAERPGDVAGVVYSLNLASITATGSELPLVIEQGLRTQLLPSLPHAAAYIVAHDPALSHRVSATRVLLQIESDPGLLTRKPLVGADGLAFNSSRFLFSDTAMGLGAYLGPLFLSRAPWVWGASAGRPGAVIAYTFGQLVLGRRSEAAEPLQLYSPTGRTAIQPAADIDPAHFDLAFRWWVEHLDRLFTEITDPCGHVAGDGSYDVFEHFESLLSLEQAFRNVQSLSTQDRDGHAQRGMLFDALDSISGVRSPDFDEMCKLACAKKALAEAEAEMDAGTGSVLLPRARAAIAALEEVQKGFFLPSKISGSGVRLPGKGGEMVVPFDTAAAQYLRVLRNSVHGFGGRGGTGGERNRALLAAHDGHIPADLPDLAYLYLLRLLARPEDLRRRAS